MNNKNIIIKPSKETLVVGARVKLRNGETTTVTEVFNTPYFPIVCADGDSRTYSGALWEESDAQPEDIMEVIPKVDVSTFKIGDTIKFKSGVTAEITSIGEEENDYCMLYYTCAGRKCSWGFKNNGTPFDNSYYHKGLAIIEHFPKPPETSNDPVAHPSHRSGIACFQLTQHMSFGLGNVVESVWCSSHKETTAIETISYLKNAQWFLNNEIERLGKQQND